MLKPHVGKEFKTEAVIQAIKEAGIGVIERMDKVLAKSEAQQLYARHAGKDYFEWLVNQIVSGPVTLLLLEGQQVATQIRRLAGKTKPEEARQAMPDSLRAIFSSPEETFAQSREEKRAVNNVIHTPDPDEYWVKLGRIFIPITMAETVTDMAKNSCINAVEREGNLFFPEDFPMPEAA